MKSYDGYVIYEKSTSPSHRMHIGMASPSHTTVDRFNELWETVVLELPTVDDSNLAAPTHIT